MKEEIKDGEEEQYAKELIKYLNEIQGETIRKGIEVRSLVIGKSSIGEWKYTLNYYLPTKDITILLKRFEKQPSSYAILKISDKITEVEDLDSLLNKVKKIYNLLIALKKELKEEGEIKKVYYI